MQKKKIPPEILKKIALFALLETVIAAVLVAVDLLSKHFVFQSVALGEEIQTLGGFLTITAVKNTGASFGIFGSSTVALTIVSFVCSLLIFAFSIYTERTRTPLLRAALVFVLAGAVGNLADRFVLGYVRDFIQFSIFPWVFNVADSYLTVGVILLLIYVVFFYSRDKERADKRKAAEGGAPTAEGLTRPEAEEGDREPDAKAETAGSQKNSGAAAPIGAQSNSASRSGESGAVSGAKPRSGRKKSGGGSGRAEPGANDSEAGDLGYKEIPERPECASENEDSDSVSEKYEKTGQDGGADPA